MTKSLAGLLSFLLSLVGLALILIYKTNFRTIEFFIPAVVVAIIYFVTAKQQVKEKLVNAIILIMIPAILFLASWGIYWYISRTIVS